MGSMYRIPGERTGFHVCRYVAAYRKPGDKNAVKKGPCMGLFLFAPMLEGEGMLRTHRLVDYSFTILSRSSEVPPITHHISKCLQKG